MVFADFIRLVVRGEKRGVAARLKEEPSLAVRASPVGAGRGTARDFFFDEIAHYLYAGDTALHMAAAAFGRGIAEMLVAKGADCRARNRRGAHPLHYAADTNHWDPKGQAEVIAYLLSIGADANAVDASGVTALHRAVRTRSAAAVKALLEGGADARMRNKTGSTPLHLAVQTTGRGGTGAPDSREEQARIVRLLLDRGAMLTDRDGRNRTVAQAANSGWAQGLLKEYRGS